MNRPTWECFRCATAPESPPNRGLACGSSFPTAPPNWRDSIAASASSNSTTPKSPLGGRVVPLDLVSRICPTERGQGLTIQDGGVQREVELTLGHIPNSVPPDLRPSPIVPREKDLADKDLKTGRFTDKMPAHEHEYWAYVPEDYNPEFKYALLVWLHPGGDTMEATVLKAWQTLCDERGIILLAPKAGQIAGWIPDETEFVKDTVEMFLEKYSIDRSRVVLHGYGGSGAFAYQMAFKYRQLFRGIATVAAPLVAPPPDNEPDFRVQFYLLSGDNDPVHRAVELSARALTEFKFPVVHATMQGAGHKYPTGGVLSDVAVWIDALDRIEVGGLPVSTYLEGFQIFEHHLSTFQIGVVLEEVP